MYETVDETFEKLSSRFNYETGVERFYVFQFDILGWGQLYVLAKDGAMRIEKGEHHAPDLVIATKEEIYLDIVNGKMSLPTAYALGYISFEGSMETVQKLVDFFPKVDSDADLCQNLQKV